MGGKTRESHLSRPRFRVGAREQCKPLPCFSLTHRHRARGRAGPALFPFWQLVPDVETACAGRLSLPAQRIAKRRDDARPPGPAPFGHPIGGARGGGAVGIGGLLEGGEHLRRRPVQHQCMVFRALARIEPERTGKPAHRRQAGKGGMYEGEEFHQVENLRPRISEIAAPGDPPRREARMNKHDGLGCDPFQGLLARQFLDLALRADANSAPRRPACGHDGRRLGQEGAFSSWKGRIGGEMFRHWKRSCPDRIAMQFYPAMKTGSFPAEVPRLRGSDRPWRARARLR
jgi:hypothetical protein